jgi:hypothetical protein
MSELTDRKPVIVSGTSEVSMPTGMVSRKLVILTSAVIASSKGPNGDERFSNLDGQTFTAPMQFEIELTSITLTSGDVMLLP